MHCVLVESLVHCVLVKNHHGKMASLLHMHSYVLAITALALFPVDFAVNKVAHALWSCHPVCLAIT